MSSLNDISQPLADIFLASRIKTKIAMLNISKDVQANIFRALGGIDKVIDLLRRERQEYEFNTFELQLALDQEDDLSRFMSLDLNRNIQSRDGETLLSRFVESNNKKMVKKIVEEGIDINAGYPLHKACELGHKKLVKFLLKHGANVNLRDRNEKTPLISTCSKFYEITFYGYDSEGDPDETQEYINKLPIVKYLIKHGADVNAQDASGRTALMYAFDNDNQYTVLGVVKYLLRHGADKTLQNNQGETVYDMAYTEKAKKILNYF